VQEGPPRKFHLGKNTTNTGGPVVSGVALLSVPMLVDEILSVDSLADLVIIEEACRPLYGESCVYYRARVTTLRVKLYC
jgi:hypothetical protein